jgi:hypothetical protein
VPVGREVEPRDTDEVRARDVQARRSDWPR